MPCQKCREKSPKSRVAVQYRPRVTVKLDRQELGLDSKEARNNFINIAYSLFDRHKDDVTVVVGFALPGATMTPPGYYLSSDVSGRLPKKLQPGDPSGLYELIQSVLDEALAQYTEQQDAAGIRGAKAKRVAVPSNLGTMDALYQEYSALMTPAEPCRSPEALAEEFKRRGHQDPRAEGDQFLEEIFGDDWAACKVQQKAAAVEPEVKTAGFDTPESIVEELILWIDNTEPLYRQKLLCYKNLVGKVDRKIYDAAKAVKLMLYCVDAAAQDYVKELGTPEDHQGGATWHDIFPRDVRIEAAKELVREFAQDMKSGEQYLQDFHAKKYQPKPEVKPEPKSAAVVKQAGGKAMLDSLELWSWIDSETPEFGQFLMRLLASVPGGDEAEGMGYEPFPFLGWQEWSMVAEMMQAVEGAHDVEYLVQKLMGPDPDGRDAEVPEVPAEDLAAKFK